MDFSIVKITVRDEFGAETTYEACKSSIDVWFNGKRLPTPQWSNDNKSCEVTLEPDQGWLVEQLMKYEAKYIKL